MIVTPRAPIVLSGGDRQITGRGFLATATWRRPGSRLPKHAHDHTNVALSAGGRFRELIGSRWEEITPWSLVCRPAGETHANEYPLGQPARPLVFELSAAMVKEIDVATDVLRGTRHMSAGGFPVLAAHVQREIWRADAMSALAIEGLLYEALTHAARSRRRDVPAWVVRVRDRLRDECSRQLTLQELATEAGVHPASLSRAFRAAYQTTIGAYLREVRIARSLELLSGSTMSIGEIAVECGFCDQSHFSRVFKRALGIAPGTHRRRQA